MDLVIQGLEVENSDLRALAKLSGAEYIERITGQAFRLVHIEQQQNKNIEMYCAEASLDFAFIACKMRLGDFGLIAIDMDSTLLAIECIDEIADMCHVKPQVAELTLRAMQGELSFSESLIRRTALLEGLPQDMLQRTYDERVRFNPGAEKMLRRIKAAGLKIIIISGGFTFFTDRIKTKLGVDYTAANTLEVVDDKLTGKITGEIIDAQEKAKILNRVRIELGLEKEQVIAVGDGANDLEMLAAAGVGIAYHAKPILKKRSTFTINYVGLDGIINFFT